MKGVRATIGKILCGWDFLAAKTSKKILW